MTRGVNQVHPTKPSAMRSLLPVVSAPYKKQKIPTALRQQAWIRQFGLFEVKCPVQWCQNKISPFSFDAGHNIPESKGGKLTIENLIPICRSCNLGMGDRYTIEEWNVKYTEHPGPLQPQEPPSDLRREQKLKKAIRLLTSCFTTHKLTS